MIDLNKFVPVPWTCPGFMLGSDILSLDLLQSINDFDFSLSTPVLQFKRRSVTCDLFDFTPSGKQLMDKVGDLVSYLNDADILEYLVVKSFEGCELPLNRFWANGIDAIKRVHSGMVVQLTEDTIGFKMSPHVDHREVIANMQLYLGPNGYDVGTTFHKANNWDITKKVPFATNTGYFCVNTEQSIHSVTVDQDITRRSLIISWTL
jgi:hypothetical protein